MPVIHANTKPLLWASEQSPQQRSSIVAVTVEAARQATASGWLWHCQSDITSRARESQAAPGGRPSRQRKSGLQACAGHSAPKTLGTLEKPTFRRTHRLRCPRDGSCLPPRRREQRSAFLVACGLRLSVGPNPVCSGAVQGPHKTSRPPIGLLISGTGRSRLRRLN
jgi:hypothetical protein